CETEELWTAIDRFSAWLHQSGGISHDPYDILGTRYGRWARRLYYGKNPLGIVLTAPLIGMEMLCPQLRTLFVRKQRYPTADAQLALALLNLYEAGRGQYVDGLSKYAQRDESSIKWLDKARQLADELLQQSISGYSGYCWGYPFDWQNVNGLMPKG